MKRILTLTMNPSIDLNTSVKHIIAERKLRCTSLRREPGGGGINVSRVTNRLGGASIALFPAGGPAGQMLQNLLDQEGIKHHPIPIEGWTRENFTIVEEATGQQFRFGMPGPPLYESEWEQCLNELLSLDPAPAYIVASGSFSPGVPKDFFALLSQKAKILQSRFILDTSGEELRLAMEAGVYLLKPNLRELGELAGEEIKDEPHQKEVAMSIVKRGLCEVVVVSLGAGGAWMVTKEGCERIHAPIVPVKSKVGAGDSMVAGIVFSLAQGRSLREAVLFGIAAGAAAVMTPGTELCRREDTERLYRQMVLDRKSSKEIKNAKAPQDHPD
jgi:6-phosphofructokinase 2